MSLILAVQPGEFMVCRLPPASPLPAWVGDGDLIAVTWTPVETSVVCSAHLVPEGIVADGPWRALMVAGPLDLGMTGVLLSIARPLAEAGVPIFAVSTYDTDYVLVRRESVDVAAKALTDHGHRVVWP